MMPGGGSMGSIEPCGMHSRTSKGLPSGRSILRRPINDSDAPRDGLSTCRPGERRDPSTPGVGDQRQISNGVTKGVSP
jgi:hypothetical protein